MALLLALQVLAAAAEDGLDGLFESLAEIPVEVSVDDRVDAGVEVADPEDNIDDGLGTRAVFLPTQGRDDVPEEEGQPAKDKHTDNDAQCFGSFALAFHLADVAFGRGGWIPVVLVGAQITPFTRDRVFVLQHSRSTTTTATATTTTTTGTTTVSLIEHLLLPRSFPVDAVVGVHHDHARDPEGYTGRDNGVRFIDFELARLGIVETFAHVVVRGVPMEEDGDEGDDPRRYPHAREHYRYPFAGHLERVLERPQDGVVSVDADAAQVHDGRRTEEDVARVPEIAQLLAEQPLVRQRHAGVEAHGEQGDEEVGERQRHDEVVGDDPQTFVPDHAEHDEEVAEHGRHHDEAHDEGFDDEQHQFAGVRRRRELQRGRTAAAATASAHATVVQPRRRRRSHPHRGG